jgi:hypothetical protein
VTNTVGIFLLGGVAGARVFSMCILRGGLMCAGRAKEADISNSEDDRYDG